MATLTPEPGFIIYVHYHDSWLKKYFPNIPPRPHLILPEDKALIHHGLEKKIFIPTKIPIKVTIEEAGIQTADNAEIDLKVDFQVVPNFNLSNKEDKNDENFRIELLKTVNEAIPVFSDGKTVIQEERPSDQEIIKTAQIWLTKHLEALLKNLRKYNYISFQWGNLMKDSQALKEYENLLRAIEQDQIGSTSNWYLETAISIIQDIDSGKNNISQELEESANEFLSEFGLKIKEKTCAISIRPSESNLSEENPKHQPIIKYNNIFLKIGQDLIDQDIKHKKKIQELENDFETVQARMEKDKNEKLAGLENEFKKKMEEQKKTEDLLKENELKIEKEHERRLLEIQLAADEKIKEKEQESARALLRLENKNQIELDELNKLHEKEKLEINNRYEIENLKLKNKYKNLVLDEEESMQDQYEGRFKQLTIKKEKLDNKFTLEKQQLDNYRATEEDKLAASKEETDIEITSKRRALEIKKNEALEKFNQEWDRINDELKINKFRLSNEINKSTLEIENEAKEVEIQLINKREELNLKFVEMQKAIEKKEKEIEVDYTESVGILSNKKLQIETNLSLEKANLQQKKITADVKNSQVKIKHIEIEGEEKVKHLAQKAKEEKARIENEVKLIAQRKGLPSMIDEIPLSSNDIQQLREEKFKLELQKAKEGYELEFKKIEKAKELMQIEIGFEREKTKEDLEDIKLDREINLIEVNRSKELDELRGQILEKLLAVETVLSYRNLERENMETMVNAIGIQISSVLSQGKELINLDNVDLQLFGNLGSKDSGNAINIGKSFFPNLSQNLHLLTKILGPNVNTIKEILKIDDGFNNDKNHSDDQKEDVNSKNNPNGNEEDQGNTY